MDDPLVQYLPKNLGRIVKTTHSELVIFHCNLDTEKFKFSINSFFQRQEMI